MHSHCTNRFLVYKSCACVNTHAESTFHLHRNFDLQVTTALIIRLELLILRRTVHETPYLSTPTDEIELTGEYVEDRRSRNTPLHSAKLEQHTKLKIFNFQ